MSKSNRPLLDSDGRMNNPKMPVGWLSDSRGLGDYLIGIDPLVRCGAMTTLCIESDAANEDGSGAIVQQCSARHFLGQRLRFSALVQSLDVEQWAGLWLRIQGKRASRVLAFDDMGDRPILGTSNWTTQAIVLDVPRDSDFLFFGLTLYGAGKVWLAGLRMHPVGLDVPTTNMTEEEYGPDGPSNLDFSE